MSIDLIDANPCQPFCDEMCEVGTGEYGTRHKSSGLLAARGGLMKDKAFRTDGAMGIDVMPSVSVAQKLGGKPAEVILEINTWVSDRVHGWVIPSELANLIPEFAMTPERAEHLAEILMESARIAREAPLSADRVMA